MFAALMSLLMFSSCSKCSKKEPVVNEPLSVEEAIKEDTDKMTAKNKKSFVWLETLVLLNNYLDEENDGSYNEISNIFQAVEDTSTDAMVYKFQHFADGKNFQDSIRGFWVEDFPLADSLIKVPYDSAFNLVMQVNLPKPHSKNAILRNPIGPKPCNPQWIFGNLNSQIWIDATTGEVRESNPAFPDGDNYTFAW